MKFRTQYNDVKKPEPTLVDDMVSKTIQGESKTVKQLLEMFAQGMPVEQRQGVYVDVEDVEKINEFYRNDLDLTDLDALREHTEYMNQVIDEAEAKKEKDDREAAEAAELAKAEEAAKEAKKVEE